MERTHILSGLVVILLFCLASSAFAVTTGGWADMNGGTTGGAGGTVVTVTTPEDFKTYVETPGAYIVQVAANLDLGSVAGQQVNITSNKTIKGIIENATIKGKLAFQQYATNIIIERLTITNPNYSDEYDGISVKENITNLFITHCTFYDCGDGCLDITEASDFITVSWCKFYYITQPSHRFVNLIGHQDGHTDDIGKLRVTMHHNWYYTLCDERMPRVRYGQVHVYNNYYNKNPNTGYCIGIGDNSHIRVESNYFYNVYLPWKRYDDASNLGQIGWNSGNIFVGCSIPTTATNEYSTVFVPPYSYTLEDTNNIPAIVMAGAGNVGPLDTTPPDAPTGLTVVSPGEANVPLDWDDNSEGDLAGYNVYRSETSGSGYSKLNGSLLTSSNYTDNITTHDTTYYYVVTAVDTSSNESDNSGEVFGGLYGDFTGNGIVEISDLPDFLDFWLETDCGLTEGLDLDDNCIVDFYEFSVLANNWKQ